MSLPWYILGKFWGFAPKIPCTQQTSGKVPNFCHVLRWVVDFYNSVGMCICITRGFRAKQGKSPKWCKTQIAKWCNPPKKQGRKLHQCEGAKNSSQIHQLFFWGAYRNTQFLSNHPRLEQRRACRSLRGVTHARWRDPAGGTRWRTGGSAVVVQIDGFLNLRRFQLYYCWWFRNPAVTSWGW